MPKLTQPLRIYNIFPRIFNDFVEMREYVKEVAKMGFNAVWLNPITKTADDEDFENYQKRHLNNDVFKARKSLYAADDLEKINPDFIRRENDIGVQEAGEIQLKELIAEIKKYKIIPIFDLVLHHISVKSIITKKRPDWFKGSNNYKDVTEFDYENLDVLNEVFEKIWKPFLDKYITEYGFEGARIDQAVIFTEKGGRELREKIYGYILRINSRPNHFRRIIIFRI